MEICWTDGGRKFEYLKRTSKFDIMTWTNGLDSVDCEVGLYEVLFHSQSITYSEGGQRASSYEKQTGENGHGSWAMYCCGEEQQQHLVCTLKLNMVLRQVWVLSYLLKSV